MSIPATGPALPAELTGAAAESKAAGGKSLGVMTPEKLKAILAAAQRLRDNPLFEEYIRAVEEYRRFNNTVPDSD